MDLEKQRQQQFNFQFHQRFTAQELESEIVFLLRNEGEQTRNNIIKKLRIPRSTIGDALTRLIIKEKVFTKKIRNGEPGRPKVNFLLKPEVLEA